jgi:MFS family permease
MMLMGLATAIGLIPGYDKIGIWAPILLVTFRIVQGISVGGEWGGAVLMASEHAPHGRKTFFASFAQLGSPAGLLLSLIAFRLVSMLDQEAFLSWGWRLPFLASGVLMMVGLFIRMRVDESPEFETLKAKRELADNPVIDVLKNYFPHIFFWLLPSRLARPVSSLPIFL